MHLVSKVLRTCGIILYLIFQVNASVNKTSNICIQSLKVNSVLCHDITCKYLLNVSGGEFLGHYPWRLTLEEAAKGSDCNVICPNYELKELETSQWLTVVEVVVPNAKNKIYFCLQEKDKNSPFGGKWVHQGTEHYLEPKNEVTSSQNGSISFTSNPQASNASEDQKIVKQASNTTKDVTDTNLQTNEQQSATDDKDIIQEINTDWVDLTHDIDVNYLPSVARPTREESKDIEVLVHRKFVPLNDIIEEFKTKNKYNIYKDYKNNLDTKETVQEYKKRNINGYLNKNYSKIKKLDKIHFEKSEALKSQINKCDKSIALFKMVLDKLNSIPNATTVENLLGISVQSDPSVQTFINDLSLNIFDEITQLLSNSDRDNLTIKENYLNIQKTNEHQTKDDNNVNQIVPELLILTDSSYRSFNEAKINQGNFKDVKTENVLEDSFPRIPSEVGGQLIRKPRQVIFDDFNSVKGEDRIRIFIEGLRIEDSDKEPKIIDDGVPSVLADSWATLRLYGEGLTNRTVIAFTHDPQPYGQPCKFLMKGEYKVKEGSLQPRTALFKIKVPAPLTGIKLYVCAKNLHLGITDPDQDEEKYAHMGTESWKMFASHNKMLPLWVSIGLIVFCLMFSALFSGLNLGLMSLDRTELKIIANTGTDIERKYARVIMPVRDHGNYLLCSILLGNVAVNSTFTILLDELTSGLFAVIFSTLAIVMLGEITPQAICSRHGLMVGANTIMVTKGVMALTAPLSFPVSKLLDYFLGEEIGNVYNRERLKELVKVTTDVNDLDKDEVNIISGALELRKKSVSDVMTKLEDVFMLPISSVLDFETMSEIVKSGYSRIPVYEGGRGNIVTVLFIKDLAFVDPDDNTPLRTLCRYYQNPCNFVFEDVTLDIMFKQFKDGHKGHMAFVHRINNEGEGDPFYETIGLVTLEDVIEEMIQAEIVDETDVFLDNRSKRRRRPQNKLQDFAAFAERHENQHIHISPQLTLATFQFLSTSVEAFRPDTVSETVLKRLLKQDVIQYIKMKGKTKKDVCTYVFQQGKPVDYFLLILEGRVEVTVGRENLVFEAGPFTYFGVQALTQNIGVAESPTPSAMGSLQNINMDAMLRHTFVPDYSVRAITSLYYLTVKRSLYLAAKRATLMEKGNISKGGTTQEFDTEVDKPLPRVNIIELMQVSQQLYPSSEKIDANDLRRMCNSASLTDPDKTHSMVQCSNCNTYQAVDDLRRIESTKHIITDLDEAECIHNNWAGKEVLDGNDSNHCKKKATFHKDTSLLSFHNISSPRHEENEIDYVSNREFRHKSNNDKPSRSNDYSTTRELQLDRVNHFKYQNDYNRDIDFTAFVKNGNYFNSDFHCNQSSDNHNNFYTGSNSKTNFDYTRQQIKIPGLKIANSSQIESKPIDFQIEYKAFETDSSNQEHKSSQEIVSTEPPYSNERFLELEKDTVDYEKEIRDERLSVERRRLETEQIMMMQLAKIIQMLERNHHT